MFTLNPISLGARGEKAALLYLKKQGYLILETNYCNKTGRRLGEIDIIARQADELVFIEVKTRDQSSAFFALPEENINHSKLYKLSKIAAYYISTNKLFFLPYRFDAITIIADPATQQAKLRHLKNIFI